MRSEAYEPCGTRIAPEGWWCSRAAGHDGPCAARPNHPIGKSMMTVAEIRKHAEEEAKGSGYKWIAPNHVLALLDAYERACLDAANVEVLGQAIGDEMVAAGVMENVGVTGPELLNVLQGFGQHYKKTHQREEAYRGLARQAKGFIENMTPSGPNYKNVLMNAIAWLEHLDALEKEQGE